MMDSKMSLEDHPGEGQNQCGQQTFRLSWRDETTKMEVLELRKWITVRDETREREREQRESVDKTKEKERSAQELEREQNTRDDAAQVTNIFEQLK